MPAELRMAYERLLAILQAPPPDDRCHAFDFGATASRQDAQEPVHRCLSQAEARAKLRAIERLTGQPLDALLGDSWDQLSPAQLLAVEDTVCRPEAGERAQPLGDQAPAWCRLDERLFRLAFTAWFKGSNFAAAPAPHSLARQIGVNPAGYRKALQRLRVALARPSAPSPRCVPRVDLWLGESPVEEAVPSMPRLWVSARALKLDEAKAAEAGLLPATTLAQERLARRELGRRWSLREDKADFDEVKSVSRQYTRCCRCGQMLAV